MKEIILASKSPQRKKLLEKLGLKFMVVSSDYEEKIDDVSPPHELAKHLSLGKAQSVAKKFKNKIIIAADTIISFNGKIMGKPHTPSKAKSMLKKLSGKTHTVITGFTIIDTSTNKTLSKSVETKVQIKKLTQKEIENYVNSKEPLDKAGAYAIQGLGSLIVDKIEGDFFNVVGLPLNALIESLKKFGINVL